MAKDNVVARLRDRIAGGPIEDWRIHMSFPVGDVAALLDVVERFAASDPTSVGLRCSYCGWRSDHANDCPWLTARRLCGITDED